MKLYLIEFFYNILFLLVFILYDNINIYNWIII